MNVLQITKRLMRVVSKFQRPKRNLTTVITKPECGNACFNTYHTIICDKTMSLLLLLSTGARELKDHCPSDYQQSDPFSLHLGAPKYFMSSALALAVYVTGTETLKMASCFQRPDNIKALTTSRQYKAIQKPLTRKVHTSMYAYKPFIQAVSLLQTP